MTPDDKNFLINFVLFWIFMLAVVSEWIVGWPTNDHLIYISIAWLTFMCCSSFYAWHLESKQE